MNTLPACSHFRDIPSDLALVIVWVFCTIGAVYLPYLSESALRVVFALPFILFIPGYVLIAALFPGRDDLDLLERIALSFGLSIAIVPLIGLALNYTPWGIRLDPIVTALVFFTLAVTAGALYRRLTLPEEPRFSVAFGAAPARIKAELFEEGASRLDRALSVLLIVAIVAALITTAYVLAVPKEGEKFTEFYILGSGGMAADYPTRFSAGEEQSVIIGIGNHEYRTVTYTVETHLLNQTFDSGTNTSQIRSMQLLDRFTVEVAHNETVEVPYTFSVDDPEVNRLQFLLFNETVPADGVTGAERIGAGYRDLHLWISVRSGGG
jgi:uncharacterized membrane protein